ncbi:hypothetical protein GCM10028805_22120 [Spirosoma harenae]
MFLSLLFGLELLVNCQPPVLAPQTYAVVVGISDYQALSYAAGDLRFADRDAQQVVAFLKSKAGGNVPDSHIRLLTNHQASQQKIKQALTLFRQAGPEDRVVFYFSGHGSSTSFVPYDTRPGSLQTLLTHKDIKTAFLASKAITKLCIADACLSGGMIKNKKDQRKAVQKAARNLSSHSNVAMMLASRSTQSAIEAGKLEGGAFTHFLLRGLTGKGDLDGNQIVTIQELHKYVLPRVKLVTRGRQTPVFYGRFSDNLPLAYL